MTRSSSPKPVPETSGETLLPQVVPRARQRGTADPLPIPVKQGVPQRSAALRKRTKAAPTHGSASGPPGDYEVGRGKPPLHTRFQKGVSGNPKGKARQAKNIYTVLQEEIHAVVAFSENGKSARASKQTLAIKSAVNKAVKGDLRALQFIVKLLESYAPPGASQTEAEKSRHLASRQETDRQVLEILGLGPSPTLDATATPELPAAPVAPPSENEPT